MIDPPLLRIGSISIGLLESNTSHTVSARRNNAAGVGAAKSNIRRRAAPSRRALTEAALSAAATAGGELTACGGVTACGGLAAGGGSTAGGGSDAERLIFAGTSAAGVGISFGAASGFGASGTGGSFAAASGLISMLACSAIISDVGGTISPGCREGDAASACFSEAAGAVATGAAGVGPADAAACEASAAGV